MLQLFKQFRDLGGRLAAELIQIVGHGRNGKKAKCRERPGRDHQQDEYCKAFVDVPATDVQTRGKADHRRQHYREQRRAIDQHQHVAQQPSHVNGKRQRECKQNVAAIIVQFTARFSHASFPSGQKAGRRIRRRRSSSLRVFR